MRQSAQGLLRIIDDVLDFSKIDAGRMDIEAAPFSLSELVAATVKTMLPQARRKHLELSAEPSSAGPDRVIGDPTRVRQILFNLVGNAIKFTDRGFVRINAISRAEGDGSVLASLMVTDSGIGMDETTRARLFEPFMQADSSTTRRFGGTGLGLSIVRRLAQLMGGDVDVETAPGEARGSPSICASAKRGQLAALAASRGISFRPRSRLGQARRGCWSLTIIPSTSK